MFSLVSTFRCMSVGRALSVKAAIVTATVGVTSVNAQDLYSIDLSVGGGTSLIDSYSTFEDFIDVLIGNDITYDGGDLVDLGYTPTSVATFGGDLRGLDVDLVFPTAGTEVQLVVPSIGLVIVYDSGTSRDDSVALLEQHLLDNINQDLSKILRALMGETPFDPLVGNPNSLQSKMVEADFGMGTGIGPGTSFKATGPAVDGEDAPNLIGIGARFGRYTAQGVDTTVIDIPLSYAIPLADPRWAVIIDAPLTYVQTGNAESYAASLGVGLRVPVFDNWTLTPAVRAGLTGSEDLGSAGTLYSASLTSNFEFELGGLDMEVGNMISYVASTPITVEVAGYDLDYDVENMVTRNGIGINGKLNRELFNQPVVWEFNAVNTQIFGGNVFIDNYTDLAFSVGTQQSTNGLTFDSLRLGLTYTFTNEDYSGFRVNFGYQF